MSLPSNSYSPRPLFILTPDSRLLAPFRGSEKHSYENYGDSYPLVKLEKSYC